MVRLLSRDVPPQERQTNLTWQTPHSQLHPISMATAFSPTQGEAALVNQIFSKHDPQSFGVITGDVAVKVFGGANLSASILGQIWAIADADNQGFLTRKGVSIAVRLLGWAQKGDAISADLVSKRERDAFSPSESSS